MSSVSLMRLIIDKKWLNDEVPNAIGALLNFYCNYDTVTKLPIVTLPHVIFGHSWDEAQWINPNHDISRTDLHGKFPKYADDINLDLDFIALKKWYEKGNHTTLSKILNYCDSTNKPIQRYCAPVNVSNEHWVLVDAIIESKKNPNGMVTIIDHLSDGVAKKSPSFDDAETNSTVGSLKRLLEEGEQTEAKKEKILIEDKVVSSTSSISIEDKQTQKKEEKLLSEGTDSSTKLTSTSSTKKKVSRARNLPTAANMKKDTADTGTDSESTSSEDDSDIEVTEVIEAKKTDVTLKDTKQFKQNRGLPCSMWFAKFFGLYLKEKQSARWTDNSIAMHDMNTTEFYKEKKIPQLSGISTLNHSSRTNYPDLPQQNDQNSCGLWVILDMIAIAKEESYEKREWSCNELYQLRLAIFDLMIKVSSDICIP
jgi:hypothetical protein